MVEISILIFCIINLCLNLFIIHLLSKNKRENKPQEYTKKKELIQDEIITNSYLGHNINKVIIDEDVSKYIVDEEVKEDKNPGIDPARKFTGELNKQVDLSQTFNNFYK